MTEAKHKIVFDYYSDKDATIVKNDNDYPVYFYNKEGKFCMMLEANQQAVVEYKLGFDDFSEIRGAND